MKADEAKELLVYSVPEAGRLLSLTSDLDAPFCKRGGKVRLPKAGKQDAGM